MSVRPQMWVHHEERGRPNSAGGSRRRRLRVLQRCVCDDAWAASPVWRASASAAVTADGGFAPPAVIPSELGFSPVAVDASAVEQLDVRGFTVFESVVDGVWLQQMRAAFEALSAEEGRLGGHEARPQVHPDEFEPPPGVRRLADLVNKGDGVFDRVWSWPTVLTLASHVIRRPFKLSSLNGHEPLSKQALTSVATTEPAYGTQRLHRDWGGGERNVEPDLTQWPGSFFVMNSIWCLDDWTNQAGATRIVRTNYCVDRRGGARSCYCSC